MEFAYRSDFSSDPASVRLALSRLRRFLVARCLTREEIDTVELVVAEVLNNVGEHSYGTATPGSVSLVVRELTNGIGFLIADAGRRMPGCALPDGDRPAIAKPRRQMPEGGFGWFMVRYLARDLTYVRRNGVNEVRFRIAVTTAPRSGRQFCRGPGNAAIPTQAGRNRRRLSARS